MTTLAEQPVAQLRDQALAIKRARLVRRSAVLIVGLIALGAGLLGAMAWGAAPLPLADVWRVLRHAEESAASSIVWNLRLPRALVGLLVGANMAVSGVLLQAVMRNPLAAPNIIGVTAGAGLAATAVLLVAPGWPTWLPMLALVGALGAAAVVYTISWQRGLGTSPVRMILAGVAISAMLGAFTSFLMIWHSERVGSAVLWMSGTLNARSWTHLRILWPYSLVGLATALLLVRPLNVLNLGDQAARALGQRVEAVRALAVFTAALLAAAAVSVAGMVGFIGLMVPHIVRLIGGNNHAYLIPAAATSGAAMLIWADLGARTIVQPTELPVGIITAVVGGPYFIFLLYRTRML